MMVRPRPAGARFERLNGGLVGGVLGDCSLKETLHAGRLVVRENGRLLGRDAESPVALIVIDLAGGGVGR